ncbi:MAG: GNAT family N-acetyltransferase [Candidatus Nanopelagicales bacterium]
MLETQRLVLREFTRDDLDDLVELDSDPEVMFFITGGRPTPREEIEREVLPVFVAGGYWAAVEKSADEFLGWFHLRPAPGHRADEPELGYRLRRAVWRRGYATEGCLALIDFAFTELGARRVVAETMAVHSASRRVMEKAGMSLVREFTAGWPDRIPGDELGDVEYAITRELWARG